MEAQEASDREARQTKVKDKEALARAKETHRQRVYALNKLLQVLSRAPPLV
jgi:hypothetical protein